MIRSQKTAVPTAEKGTLPRQVGLAFALGLLGILVFVFAANAYVAKKTETTLADFDTGTFVYTGLLDIPEQAIDSVQLLPIGLTGGFQASSNLLPLRLTDLATIVNGDRIYVLGGIDEGISVRSEVFASQMNLGGDVSSWQSQTPLPQVRAAASAAVHPLDDNTSTLYLVGGYGQGPDFAVTDTIFRAPINHATGQVGTWVKDTQTLPVPLDYASAVVHGNALYVIGGEGNSGVLDSVNYATINANGSLNSFVATSSLITPTYDAVAIVYEGVTTDTLYLIGGFGTKGEPPNQNPTSFPWVFFADFKPGGGLTEWKSSEGQLPNHIFAHDGVLIHGEIILTGGIVDSIYPGQGISNTVKAALVDTDNASFRLYDWCLGKPPPMCTIGAWQTGGLLPEVRASHGSATGHGYIYVLGGVNKDQDPQNTVYYGRITGVGALYSPEGYYLSDEIYLGQEASLVRLDWDATIGHPGAMDLTMQYHCSSDGVNWSTWSDPVSSVDGPNQIVPEPPPTGVQFVQYKANFSTTVNNASPLLDRVEIYYEVDDPEVAVSKHTGEVISVTSESDLQYTIIYTNYGDWVAENVMLTETVPANTTYAGGPEWHQIGTSDVYTYKVGDLGRGATGSATFQVQVNQDVPKDTLYIINGVSIDYPPMTDAFLQRIVDPKPGNNYFEFSNPYLPYAITITKDFSTARGHPVHPDDVISYTLVLSNELRAAAATNVYVLDQLPEHTTYLPGSIFGPGANDTNPDELRWDLAIVAPGQSDQAGFAVTVDQSTPSGTVISNTATIFSDNGPPRASNPVTTSVIAETYVLQATKGAIPPPGSVVQPGSFITYTIHYSNSGSMPASQAVLTDIYDLHESYGYVSADPPPNQGDNVWYLGPLAPDHNGMIDIVVQLNGILPSNWPVTNRAGVAGPEGPPWYSPVVTHVVMNPPGTALTDLVVGGIRMSPANPEPGAPVDFRVTISNEGSLAASTEFWVSLYIRPSPSSPPSGPSDHDYGYCLDNCAVTRPQYVHYVSSLDQGDNLEIAFESSGNRPAFPAEGSYDVYVQVDVAWDDPYYNWYWGAYPEQDEGNNTVHMAATLGGPPRVYLPAIYKNGP